MSGPARRICTDGTGCGYLRKVLTLGEELLLVALDPDKGLLAGSAAMQVGLNAAALAELAEAGCVRLRLPNGAPGVTVVAGAEASIAGRPLLTEALEQARSMREGDRHPERAVKNWVAPSLLACLSSLRDHQILAWDRPTNGAGIHGRFRLLDTEAAASARARVERVAIGAGPSERDLNFAGIVHGLGLDASHLYKGRRDRKKRAALAAAVERQRFSVLLSRVLPQPSPGQKFTFDSSRDLRMAVEMGNAWDRTP